MLLEVLLHLTILARKSIILLVGKGGSRGTKNCEHKHFVKKLPFPKLDLKDPPVNPETPSPLVNLLYALVNLVWESDLLSQHKEFGPVGVLGIAEILPLKEGLTA